MASRPGPRVDKRRGSGKLYLSGFTVIIVLFAWHNSAHLSSTWSKAARETDTKAARQRLSLEGSSLGVPGLGVAGQSQAPSAVGTWAKLAWSSSEEAAERLAEAATASLNKLQQQLSPTVDQAVKSGSSNSGPVVDSTSSEVGAIGIKKSVKHSAGGSSPMNGADKLSSSPVADKSSAASNDGSSRVDDQKAHQEQQRRAGAVSSEGRLIQRSAPPPPAQPEGPFHSAARTVRAAAEKPTLVVYVYFGFDFEHEERLVYFVRAGMGESDGVTYRVVVAHPGDKKLATLPKLPSNAKYVLPAANRTCNSTWGAIAAVLPQLPINAFDYIVVTDSHVMGPLLPTYITAVMHWTEVLTRKLNNETKMSGSFISCEGAPKGGAPGGEWRLNPYILPHAWATDKVGWGLLSRDSSILRCYDGYWDTRYHSDLAASLAVLNAGYNLDSLLLRYQGVDWRSKDNWACNARVRPDRVSLYDGIMASPYEVMFLPLSMAEAQHRLMLRTGARYSKWIVPETGVVDVSRNEYWSQEYEGDWSVRGRSVLTVQHRWSCFDEDFYLRENPDVAKLLERLGSEGLAVWEHFLVMGQFQGRVHRFVCGEPALSKEDGVKLLLQRGRACFDHDYYKQQYTDLGVYTTQKELWLHYVKHGQFERRKARFVCPDSMNGLVMGFDGTPAAQLESESQELLRKFTLLLKSRRNAEEAVEALDNIR